MGKPQEVISTEACPSGFFLQNIRERQGELFKGLTKGTYQEDLPRGLTKRTYPWGLTQGNPFVGFSDRFLNAFLSNKKNAIEV